MTVRSIALGLLLAAGLSSAAGAADGAAPSTAATDQSDPSDQSDQTDPNDLGRGLRYARFSDLALAESAAAAMTAPALILDLRIATADTTAAARLRELLPQRGVGRPLFILLGVDTPASLRAAVPATAPGVLTLANAQAGLAVSLAVSTDSARDRAAVAALAAGRPWRELIEEKLDKPRFDEARLARNHANGRRKDDEIAPDPVDTKDKEKAAAPPEPALQDLVLQRAIFLHRALLALGRLPRKD